MSFLRGDIVRLHASGYLATVRKPLPPSRTASSSAYSILVHEARRDVASWFLEHEASLAATVPDEIRRRSRAALLREEVEV